MDILNYYPGQSASIFLEVFDGYGQRVDSSTTPVVTRLILPNLDDGYGYPTDMISLDVGLYYYSFTLPTGAASIGSYIADVEYTNFESVLITKGYQLIVQAPFGNYSTTVGA